MAGIRERSLKSWLAESPLDLAEFLELSIILTKMVYKIHQQYAYSGGINPSNIGIQLDAKRAVMNENAEWDAAYRAPEQSSRIPLIPDGRSDLYVLGFIFYELLSGRKPFEPEGEEDWEYVHLTAFPRLLSVHRSDLGGPLQDVIMKLLSKLPEDRYQSAYGLLCDLEQCEARLARPIDALTPNPGYLDTVSTFKLPDKLYGRNIALDQLESGLHQAAAGLSVFRWLTGDAGSGKSALVQHYRSVVFSRGGWFVQGDARSQADTPFQPILEALRQWISQLWSEPVESIAKVKELIRAEFRKERQTLTELLPEVRSLLDIKLDVPHVPSMGAKLQHAELLARLIRCIATHQRPMVMFIDHLQTCDPDTLEVLKLLVGEQAAPGLMLIGAYQTLADPSSRSHNGEYSQLYSNLNGPTAHIHTCSSEQIDLRGLAYEEVRQYISDVMYEDSARIRLFARSVYYQTSGNPQSIRLLLERWSKEKRLKFDEVQQRWMWDAEVIAQRNDSEDSRRLNEAALAKLREETKVVLGIAAAIGSRFSLSLLAEASDNSLDVTLGLLEAAVNEGIVCPEDENLPGNIGEDVYLFIDDQVQRMVYTHYQDNSAEWHLKIGRLLQRRCSDEDLKAKSNIIDHLNMGMERMSEREKGELAAHNLEAGLQAQDAAQFSRARHYFDIGLQLIPHTSTDYRLDSLASRLKVALARCEYMCGHTEVAKHQLQELLKYQVTSSSRTERSKIFINLIQMHTFEDNERAVHFGREALSEFGWLLRTNVSKATLMKEVIHTSMFLYRMKEQRYHASPNDEPDYRALSELMEAVFFPLLIQNAESLIALYARFIRYGLQKGINKYLVRIIGIYELILQRGLPSVFHVRPATQLERMQSVLRTESNLQYQLSLISGISKQLENPAEAMVHLDKALHWSVEHSDALYANLAVVTSLINHLGDIHELSERLAYFEHKSKTFADHSTLEVVSTAHAYQAALQDETLHERFVAIPISHGTEHEPEDEDNYSCGCRLEVAYLAGKYREALYWAKRGRANELDQDWVRIRKHRLLEMLALAAIYPEASSKERICIQKTLQKQLRLMKKRKGYLGSASSAYLLLQAEYNGIVLADHDATRGYSSAIRAARAEKNGLMEGIACERLAVYYQNELGSQAGTMIAMMDACTAYSVWGISSKVTQIRSQYADLLNHAVNTYAGPVFEMDMNSQAAGMPLHAGSGARSYPIQAEAEPRRQTADWTTPPSQGQVMERLLTAALHQVGADRGLVLNYRDEIFRVEAKSESSSYGGDRDLTYAESILRHTVMTDKPIVLQDALESHYIKDPYIQDRCPRSILCMRIMIPGERAVMLLYLENGHVPKVFTDQDVNVLELMIIQMFYHKMLAEDTASTAERVEAGINNKTGPGRLVESLTNREMEILKAISEGLSNKGIAERFGITEPTVKSHISNIFGKLDVKRRGQAVARARDLQLIP